ncbi:MAG: GFA family protein [Myxococcales bacterium]|nr:GFA family protein [Myxococcales bacterium]
MSDENTTNDDGARTYAGGCHCGAVRFEITMPPPDKVFECNCSICAKTGWQLGFAPQASFRLLQGEQQLRDYQFNKRVIHHLFCGTCGIRSFGRGLGHDGAPWISVNLRCLDGFDASGLPVQRYDGASL